MKNNEKNDHPEIKEIKNICEVSPTDKKTKDICDALKKNKKNPPKK